MGTPAMTAEQIAAANRQLATAPRRTILRWAVDTFGPKLTMATAFGAEGCCLIHMLAEIEPRRPHLQPRHRLPVPRDAGAARADRGALRHRGRVRPAGADGRRVRGGARRPAVRASGPTSAATTARSCRCGGRWSATTPGSAPSAATRPRDRGGGRRGAVGREVRPGEGQPAADAGRRRTSGPSSSKHDVPYNPLHDQGYPSIGCWPCTRPVGAGEDERAGRWAGTVKKECGLHVIEDQGGSGI